MRELKRLGRLDYLKQYGSGNMVQAYEAALKNFFEMVYDERDGLEQLAERYFRDRQNHEEDIKILLGSLLSLPE